MCSNHQKLHHPHPFSVTLPYPRTLAHKSSFTPRRSQSWNSLPSTTLPESNNLSSSKHDINKRNLVSLSTKPFLPLLCFSFVGAFLYAPRPFLRHYLLKPKIENKPVCQSMIVCCRYFGCAVTMFPTQAKEYLRSPHPHLSAHFSCLWHSVPFCSY